MAKHKKKIAAKPGRLDKYLPLVQTLRDKISLLKDPSSMQDEGFKEHVEQALASIVNFKSPQTWAPNLSLGDGFFNNLSSSAFLPSVIYIKAPGSRKENKSVFAQLIERAEHTKNAEFISVFFKVLKEQLQKLGQQQPVPKIFSQSLENRDSDIETMIEGMKNMLFIQIIHKGTADQLRIVLSSTVYEGFNVNVRTEIRDAALPNYKEGLYDELHVFNPFTIARKAIAVTALDALLLTSADREETLSKINILSSYGLSIEKQRNETVVSANLPFSPEEIIAPALRACFDAEDSPESAIVLIEALLETQYPRAARAPSGAAVPISDWLSCLYLNFEAPYNPDEHYKKCLMRFKHYFHTVMGQLIDNNIVLAPVDKEANRLGLIEMGFLPGAKTQQNIVSGDIIARLGKTSTDIWPEDLYTLFASKEPSQELFHRILKELLFPIFITKTNPDSEETVFEMQHNTYEREFIAGDLRRDRNPRFNRLLPLIEGFCAVADPTQLIANTEQFAEIINQFSVQIIGYYYPPNSLLATQRAIDSDLIELALFLINTQKNFAPGDATAQEALNKLCAPILKKLVFYQYTSTQLYTSPINPNSQASPELMASFLDALGVDMYLYFIHSWVKDVKILPECEEIDLNAASKVQQLPFPNVKLFNEAVTVLITGYIELKNTVDSISEIDSIERQSLSRKMKVVYQSIEALFFRTTAICDANSLTRHHTYALSNFFNVCILRSPNPHLDSNRREQVLRQLIAFEKSSVTVEQLLAEHELVPQWLKVSTFLALFNLDSQQFPKCTQLPVAIKTFQRTQNALAFSRPNRQNVHTASENITASESADKLIAQYMTDPVNQNTLFTLEDALFKELEISILRTLENLSIEEQNKLLLQTMPDYMSSSISAFFQGPTGSTPAQREGYCKTLLNLYGIYAQDRYKLPNASATMESAYRTLVGFNYARSLTTPISGYSFTIPTLLHVVVLAIDDFKTYKDSHPTETDDEIQKMIQGLHQQLRIALRELIISYQEITPPIPSEVYCQDGVVKRILQILDKIHPSVQLFCFDTETLRGILTETVDTTFASLPYDEQQQIIMSVEAEIAPFQTSTQDGLLKSQLYSAVIPVELMRQVKPAYLTAQTSQQLTLEAAIEKGLLDRALVESYFPNPESSRAEIEVPLIGCQRIILYWQLMQILRKAPSITWQGLKPMLLEIRDKINGILTESDNGITLFGDHFDFLENAFTRYNEQIKSKPSPSSPKSTAPTVAQIGVFGARPKRIQEREDEEPTMKRPRKIDEQLPKEKEEKRRAEEDLPEDELEKRGKRFR